MGVKGLLQWVKATHPKVITSYPSRWAAPIFKGKKVAIDATLLTNRYHFASRDGPFKDKGEIVGWYNLVSEMRAYGVEPVAIWDQRGVREWKASEARRRLTVRAGHLARRNHEIERSSRLHHLREVLGDFTSMSTEEREIVKAHYEITRFMFLRPKEASISDWDADDTASLPTSPISAVDQDTDQDQRPISPPIDEVESLNANEELPHKAEDRDVPAPAPKPPSPESVFGGPSKSEQLSSTLTEADDMVIERVITMIDSLAPLIQEYRDSRRSLSAKEGLDTDTDVLGLGLDLGQEVVQMEEELREEWPITPTSREKQKMEELDETLADLVPSDRFTETPRQMVLTKEEGEIINDILSPSRSPLVGLQSQDVDHTPPPTPPSSPMATVMPTQIQAQTQLDAMTRLDHLIDTLPSVRGIYERALDIPSAADHEDCKELLRTMGVPVLEAKIPYEAEGLASALARRGLVDYVGSEDSDVLAYEGPFLRHLSPATSPLALISGVGLRESTCLPPSSYLDFLILLGTDASSRIPKVGPVTALKLIRTHGSIEAILEAEKGIAERLVDKVGFWEGVHNARKVFTELPPTDHLQGVSGSQDQIRKQNQSQSQIGDDPEALYAGAPLELELKVGELEQRPWDEKEVERFLEEKHGIKLVESEFSFESS